MQLETLLYTDWERQVGMLHHSLDERYKTRIPWRSLLEIPADEGIPHGKRDFNTSKIAQRRQAKADRNAAHLANRIKKKRLNPWRFSNARFFPDQIFLKKINNHDPSNLRIPSCFDGSRSHMQSTIDSRNYLDDIVDPRMTRGQLQPRTIPQVGPGAYLRAGNRSVLRRLPMPKRTIVPSASFASIERNTDVFIHMMTFEKERNMAETKRIEYQENERKKKQNHTLQSHRHRHSSSGPVSSLKHSKMLRDTTKRARVPLKRAIGWYKKYGKEHARKDEKEETEKRKKLVRRQGQKEKENGSVVAINDAGDEDYISSHRRRFERQVIPLSIQYLKEGRDRNRDRDSGGDSVMSKKKTETCSGGSIRLFSRDVFKA